jgi:hypothetical protein
VDVKWGNVGVGSQSAGAKQTGRETLQPLFPSILYGLQKLQLFNFLGFRLLIRVLVDS